MAERDGSRLRWVFVGPDGIRAGWSLLIYFAVFGAVGAVIAALITHFAGAGALKQTGELSGFGLLANEAFMTAGVLGMSRMMARIERRSFLYYGLSPADAPANFALGLICGFIALSAVIAILFAGGYITFAGLAIHGLAIPANALLLLAGFTMVGVAEETLFRGYLLSTLTRGIGFWPGAVVSSLIFAATHLGNGGETALGIAQVFVAGMLFAGLLWISGSLWLGIGFHAAWDWAQSYFYGTPDSGLLFRGHLMISHAAGDPRFSGGPAGPEGSLLATPVLALALAATAWIYRRTQSMRST